MHNPEYFPRQFSAVTTEADCMLQKNQMDLFVTKTFNNVHRRHDVVNKNQTFISIALIFLSVVNQKVSMLHFLSQDKREAQTRSFLSSPQWFIGITTLTDAFQLSSLLH